MPFAGEVDLAALLSVVLDHEPVVEAAGDGERAELDRGLANEVALAGVFVQHLDVHVVADVLDVNDEHFSVPVGLLASLAAGLGADALHAGVEETVDIHLSEGLGVAGEARLEDADVQFSSC